MLSKHNYLPVSKFFGDIFGDIFSDIFSDTFSDIFSDTFSDIFSEIAFADKKGLAIMLIVNR
jgi:hypothetical protein